MSSKGMRFFFAFIIVIITSSLCFFLVKSSIDWAINSKAELNRLQELARKDVIEEISRKVFSFKIPDL